MATNSKEKQREYDKKRAGKRSRVWACIVYPESAPADWLEQLKGLHLRVLVSPLHDRDVDAEGNPKKPHYHVLIIFEAPVALSTAKQSFSVVGYTGQPEQVNSARGYARYLLHMDDHDKFPYFQDPACKVMEIGGASWSSIALDEAEELDRILDEIEDWIDEQGVTSYRVLCAYARSERPEWKHVVRTHTIHCKAYLRSMEYDCKG